jgi:Tfp pilus assembly protein PilO
MIPAFDAQARPARWFLLLLILAAAYAHHRWVYAPWRGEREDLETRLVLVTAEIRESSQTLVAREGALEDHVATLTGRLHSLESRLPDAHVIQQLPARIQTEARHWGLRLVSLRPEPVHSEALYAEERFHITVEGRYHAIGRFLAALGSTTYLLKVSELRMMSIQDHTLARVSLSISTYVRPWTAPAMQVQIASLLSHPDDLSYPAEPLSDPMDLPRADLRHRPSPGWPRLRSLLLAPDPQRSMASFEAVEEPVQGAGGAGPRERLFRVRIGDRIGSATVVGIGPHGVELRRDGNEAGGGVPELITLEPGTHVRTRLVDPDSAMQP